jgi:hypothetical protein
MKLARILDSSYRLCAQDYAQMFAGEQCHAIPIFNDYSTPAPEVNKHNVPHLNGRLSRRQSVAFGTTAQSLAVDGASAADKLPRSCVCTCSKGCEAQWRKSTL